MQSFRYRRSYNGRLQALVFDWAGTIIDYGSRAPFAVFSQVFANHGVQITTSEAREPMGKAKRAHIETVLAMPRVAQLWRDKHGRAHTSADVDTLYAEFLPLQLACLANYCEMIPGALKVIEACRRRGLKIGTSTGYVKELMEVVLVEAERQGFTPDAMVCASDVAEGRPAPWMCFENARRLNVYPMSSTVKIDDTPVGIEAGLNAGMWTVGVALSGNEMGLSRAEVQNLPERERVERLGRANAKLGQCGAHYVIDSVADLVPVLVDIERRLSLGEQP
jgi:phosphonoacetaldehyde hydrolase